MTVAFVVLLVAFALMACSRWRWRRLSERWRLVAYSLMDELEGVIERRLP